MKRLSFASRKAVAFLTIAPLIAIGVSGPVSATTFSFTANDFELKNDAAFISDTGGVVEMQLTPPQQSMKGGFWSKEAISLYDNFVLDGELYLGSEAATSQVQQSERGADGIAFTLYENIPTSISSATGNGLGYSGTGTVFAVEWDTYHNSTFGDLGSEGRDMSMALVKSTANHSVAGSTYAPVVLIPRATTFADDGTWRKFQISWSATAQEITVRYDLNSDGSFSNDEIIFDQVFANLRDAGGLFAGANGSVHWGFTASTGLFVNDHRVRISSGALTVTTPPPPPYEGPLLSSASPNPAKVGETVTLTGSRLTSVSKVSIDGVIASDLKVTDSEISFTVPEVTPGTKDLLVTSSFGSLTVQSVLRVSEGVISPRSTLSTKRIGDKLRVVSLGNEKVRFVLNGKRVVSRSSLGTLNRTFDLVDGKNVIEIYVDGKRVLRRAATK